ncbi:hypothetical protein N177_2009 [Lutibaculum baratangense AMV1]|uniref:Proteasome-type protease n=1 Tax=Lutibaculum baratangense AMV1 TaxID=631454 RepID=V4RPL2_9HYPH|nr:hypothetical protein N177_2009 [Lutibaculum baratangense AMV1]
MTYCVGLLVRDGIVIVADTRTNAGLDNIATFRKLHVFEKEGERVVAMATAGNLAAGQAVLSYATEGIKNPTTGKKDTVWTTPSMFETAHFIGGIVREVYRVDGKALEHQGGGFDVSILLAGQIGEGRTRLFMIYAAGNFIEATADTPYLQIGEHKYGKPILDRAATVDTGLQDALKLALISMDSTMRSNLSVGMPIDVFVYCRDQLKSELNYRIGKDEPYFQNLRTKWSEALQAAHRDIPPRPTASAAEASPGSGEPVGPGAAPVRLVPVLELEKNRGVIRLGELELVDHPLEPVAHLGRQRQVEPDGLGFGDDRVQVLEVHAHHAARREVAVEHALTVHLEDSAVGEAAPHRRPRRGGIGATGRRQQQRLGDRADVDGDDRLVGELHELARAARPDMRHPAHGLQNRPHLLDVGGVAPDHDGERALLRPDRASGYRRVEMSGAELTEALGVIPRHRWLDRAHVDDDRIPVQGFGRALLEEHLAHDGTVLEHGDDDCRAAHRLGRRVGDACAFRGQRLGLGAGAVPHRHLVPGGEQPARHRRPHQADAQNGHATSCHQPISPMTSSPPQA